VKHTAMAVLLGAALGSMAFARAAEARNPHCAGGIQYVVQGLNDKNKGNFDDYKREMQKAVQQLEQCASEDPADLEAVGYLGWAYAELDSSCLAGRMFDKAITGLEAKDKKKADWARNNRDSYWAIAFNNGITRINEAQAAYPDFQKAADNDADKALKEEARKKYLDAAANLTRASCLKPGDPRTLRNLGSAYAFTGDVEHARSYFEAGLKVAPNDSALVASMNSVHLQLAGALIDKGKFDEAVAIYSDVVKSDPKNSDLYLGLAEAHFKKAQSLQGDARKPEFKLAADAYAKAGELKPGNADLPFNAALAYQNAGELPLAETQWRAALKLHPDDPDVLSALGSTLSDEKKFDEAIGVLQQAVVKDPKKAMFHRQLGAVYTKAGNNAKGTEEFMMYLALTNGKAAADPAAEAKKAPAGSAAAKTLASMAPPEQVNVWEADGQKYQSWFYWNRKVAFHFNPTGTQLQKSDWGAAAPASGKK